MNAPCLILSAVLGLVWAQDDISGTASQPEESSKAASLDADAADSLAARLLRSALAPRITDAAGPEQRLADIRKWIDDNPVAASQLAAGLSRDDREGSRRFETSLLRGTGQSFRLNPEHVRRSTYGRLRESSRESKLMGADAEMSEEEKREILKTMFEGQGGMSNQIVTQAKEKDNRRPEGAAAGGAAFAGAYYDRLSRLNLRGYSPQLLAMQSALNQRRVPGAPRLSETGKLDYETLSYPAYGMRYDLRNLEGRLRYQENFELARLAGLGGRYRPEQLLDPEVEAQLKRQVPGSKLDQRFAQRRQALERAAAALRDFETAALRAKDPAGLTRGLLVDLGAKQREAARWITVAALEEELQRLDSEKGFLTPELKDRIAAAPVPEATRAAYQRRGEELERTLLQMQASAQDCIRRLESDDWQTAVSAVGSALSENAARRNDLSRSIQDFAATPYRLCALYRPQPRWRDMLEGAAARYLPGTPWGRQLRERQRQRETLQDVFAKIATGDLAAAHTILTADAPPQSASR